MSKTIIKLSELPHGSTIDIGGIEYTFKGFEKRKTKFGNIEHFVFQSEKPKNEKIFERFKFAATKIKSEEEKYKW